MLMGLILDVHSESPETVDAELRQRLGSYFEGLLVGHEIAGDCTL